MTTYTNLSGSSVDGVVETSLQGMLMGSASTMPSANAMNEGAVVLYTGATTVNYTNGKYYKCVEDSNVYSWVEYNPKTVDIVQSISSQSTSSEVPSALCVYQALASQGATIIDTTITLPASGWDANTLTQTVNVSDMTPNALVWVSANPSSYAEYGACGVRCTAQGTGTLTFLCTSIPENNLSVDLSFANNDTISRTANITLPANGWNTITKSQSVTVSDMTSASIVWATPNPANFEQYCDAGIYASAQSTDALTFRCTNVPTNDVVVNVVWRG